MHAIFVQKQLGIKHDRISRMVKHYAYTGHEKTMNYGTLLCAAEHNSW